MTDLTQQEAARLAQLELDRLSRQSGLDLAFGSNGAVEHTAGWVFFWTSTEHLRAADPMHALAGNAPIFVTRMGAIHLLATARSWEDGVRELQRSGEIPVA